MERQQKSIRRNVRLNERNVNHKKLRAFKSPTRWCTFALITLHLSFLPWPPSSGVVQPRAQPLRENAPDRVGRIPPFSFRPDSNCGLSFFHLSFAFRENEYLLLPGLLPSFALSLFLSLCLCLSWLSRSTALPSTGTFSHSLKFPTANRSPSGSYALGDN